MNKRLATSVAVLALPLWLSAGCQHRGTTNDPAIESAGQEAADPFDSKGHAGLETDDSDSHAKRHEEQNELAKEEGYSTYQPWYDSYKWSSEK